MSDSSPFLRLPVELQIKILKSSFEPYYVGISVRKAGFRPRLHCIPEDFEYFVKKVSYPQPMRHYVNALLVSPDTYKLVQKVLQENPVVLDLEPLRECIITDSRATMTGGVLSMLSNTRSKTIGVIELGDWYSKGRYPGGPSPPLSDLIDTSRLSDLESVSLVASVKKEGFNLFESPSRTPELLSGQHDEAIFVATMRDPKYDWRPKPVTREDGYLVSAKGRVIPIEVCAGLSTYQLLPTISRKHDNEGSYVSTPNTGQALRRTY